MTRRIPRRALPHRGLVIVEPLHGAGAGGRAFGPPVTLGRALIADGLALRGSQYEQEAEVSAVVYCERAEFGADLPFPDSKVTLWAGQAGERWAMVKRSERYEHPQIADVVVLVLR
ncbi:hypothetical protein [Leucobacter luti]|uniref:hypothetical protein n=1 Tax=Leucobacter luti TaxID=340320 RepID=UPI003D08D2AE